MNNIQFSGKYVPVKYNANCFFCSDVHVVDSELPESIKELTVTGIIKFKGAICPTCGKEGMYTQGGVFKRNETSGEMERIGSTPPNEVV